MHWLSIEKAWRGDRDFSGVGVDSWWLTHALRSTGTFQTPEFLSWVNQTSIHCDFDWISCFLTWISSFDSLAAPCLCFVRAIIQKLILKLANYKAVLTYPSHKDMASLILIWSHWNKNLQNKYNIIILPKSLQWFLYIMNTPLMTNIGTSRSQSWIPGQRVLLISCCTSENLIPWVTILAKAFRWHSPSPLSDPPSVHSLGQSILRGDQQHFGVIAIQGFLSCRSSILPLLDGAPAQKLCL